MKIYLFNPDTGIYLGEDFADENPLQRGVFVLPPDATTIAPPQAGNGQILVFNFDEERWEAREGTRIHRRHCQDGAEERLPNHYPSLRCGAL